MDLRSIVKHSIIYGSGVWAGKAIGFIMIPIYTHALTPSDYGLLELISQTTDIAAVLLGMGLASALFRFHAEGRTDAERDRITSTSIVFAGAVGFWAALCMAAAATPLSRIILGSANYAFYLRLSFIAIGLELCTAVPMALLRIHERSALFTTVNLGRLVLSLVLNIYLVVLRRMGVEGVLVSGLVSISAVLVFLFALTSRYWKPRIDIGVLRSMLAYSLPLVPSSLSMFVLNFGDRYFLRACCSYSVLGVYSLGYKLCLVMPALVMQPLGLAWTAAMFPIAAREDANRVYARFFIVYMFCVAFSSLGLAVLSRDLISLMADSKYQSAHEIVPVVLLGFFAWAGCNIFETGVLLEKKTYYRTIGGIIAAVVAVVMYAVLIPRFRAMGAAWATVSCFVAMAVSVYVFSNRVHPIPYDLRRAMQMLALGGVTYALSQLIPGEGTVLSVLLRVLIIALYPLVLYATGFFERSDVQAAKQAIRAVLDRIRLVPESV